MRVASEPTNFQARHFLAPSAPLRIENPNLTFEATIVITVFLVGDAETLIDQKITQGGPFETPEPFTVTLDLTGTSLGDVASLLARGDTRLDTDPGDFGAIPVLITG